MEHISGNFSLSFLHQEKTLQYAITGEYIIADVLNS